MIFGTLAWTIELYMTKYIIGEIFSSGRATLYRNPSDQTVPSSLKSPHKNETGGLSGKPLKDLSTNTLKDMYLLTKGMVRN